VGAVALFRVLAVLIGLLVACDPRATPDALQVGGAANEGVSEAGAEADEASAADLVCPPMSTAPERLPGVHAEHEDVAYWLRVVGERHDLDAALMTPSDVADFNASVAAHGSGLADLAGPLDVADVLGSVQERLAWIADEVDAERYVDMRGRALSSDVRQRLAPVRALEPTPELRVALDTIQVWCAPLAGPYYRPSLDLRFNRNNCSSLRPQEPVRVVQRWGDDLLLVRAQYTIGWIASDAPLSPEVPDAYVDAFVSPFGLRATRDVTATGSGATVDIPRFGRVATTDGTVHGVVLATRDGFITRPSVAHDAFAPQTRPLTRRAVLEEAFAMLNTPYGWGGQSGGRDCSRYTMDVLAGFGLAMPRFSGDQATATSFHFDLSEVDDPSERLMLLDAADRAGIVLLHFPGHIMIYLGRDADGVPMAIHSFAEYLVPCDDADAAAAGRTETLLTVDTVSVSNLELGRDTSRRAFIERVTRVSVLAARPSEEIDGMVTLRPTAPVSVPASCPNETPLAAMVSPRSPNAQQPLRVIASSGAHPGATAFYARAPDGTVSEIAAEQLGGPPFSYVATLPTPAVGDWTIALGDGQRIDACVEVRVRERAATPRAPSGVIWEVEREWDASMEDFYSAFIEKLFDYPLDEDLTWPNLHSVLRNADNNLLYDHFSLGEEEQMRMAPDCADLPYYLRAYFAWKMGLPFGYRACSRGRAGRPPRCDGVQTNLQTPVGNGVVGAFERFVNRPVRGTVHSSSGRTLPHDEESDLYPVALTRRDVRPGTTYFDPYGHVMLVTRWVPQGTTENGILMAADAQPDSTVGRRRFWRGTFLFVPETDNVGAGFKAFRPLAYDARTRTLTPVPNDRLVDDPRYPRFSTQMYDGSHDDFYDAVEALINPRPLDPWSVLVSLVDGLEESVVRRVNSVDNGEAFMRGRSTPMEMPSGASIFLTSGPWEDFSTPSRDMRLLIAIDTVARFPDVMRRAPERFGVEPHDAEEAAAELERRLAEVLVERRFTYTRSDGSPTELSLADVLERVERFEMAYNPNDCVEIRWAAPEGSEEMSTCRRYAPADQRRKMDEYRPWFAERRRP